jgi:dethiobiotin synthetase
MTLRPSPTSTDLTALTTRLSTATLILAVRPGEGFCPAPEAAAVVLAARGAADDPQRMSANGGSCELFGQDDADYVDAAARPQDAAARPDDAGAGPEEIVLSGITESAAGRHPAGDVAAELSLPPAKILPLAPAPREAAETTHGLIDSATPDLAPAPPSTPDSPTAPNPSALPGPSTLPDSPTAPGSSAQPHSPDEPGSPSVLHSPVALGASTEPSAHPAPDIPDLPDQPTRPDRVPVSPAPVGAPLADSDIPTGEALGAEISAELSAQTPLSEPGTPATQAAPSRPGPGEWRGIVLVTGTDTDVGKTIVTAAIAAAAQASGLRVAVIKPGQTGMSTGAPTDIDVVNRLAAPETARTLAEYPEPMAPLAAATVASMPPLELYDVVDAVRAEAEKHDLVLVEGAGGLLVPMGVRPSGEAWTVADLATTLGVSTIVVARAGLGTLNHTALTLEALNRRGIPAGVVIGAWPAEPELVHWANLSELVPHLVGALPQGAGRMDPGVFRRSAPGWLTPALHGVLDNWRVWAEETGEGHH